ncbi:MAG: hypothetical protein ONB53_10240, partial [candidate division KSB1 bacterium]|nr:hypothetical protein [candidate division KSB1 bacterium]MDZ7409302.1 hypothetical protein [candidate division KSB1 bacterium]
MLEFRFVITKFEPRSREERQAGIALRTWRFGGSKKSAVGIVFGQYSSCVLAHPITMNMSRRDLVCGQAGSLRYGIFVVISRSINSSLLRSWLAPFPVSLYGHHLAVSTRARAVAA